MFIFSVIGMTHKTFVEIGADQLSVSSDRFHDVTTRLEARGINIPFQNILMTATHTHGGASISADNQATRDFATHGPSHEQP